MLLSIAQVHINLSSV